MKKSPIFPKYRTWQLHIALSLAFFAAFPACSDREQAIPISADFAFEVVDGDYSVPVQVRIINATEGADTYAWDFSGGVPAISSDRNPGTITYNQAGIYSIRLRASNRDSVVETKEVPIAIDAEIIAGFTKEILVDGFPPVEVALTNTSVGADTYRWSFPGGDPLTSTAQHPDNVVYNTPGQHTISLEVSNGLETHQVAETITVEPHLVADFDYSLSFEDADREAPLTLNLNNTSISATDFRWSFTGGNPATSNEETPFVTFDEAGTYTLQLEASNGKATQTTTKTITVLPNSNIRSIEDVQLGINTAHSNDHIGAFYATKTGIVYPDAAINSENGEVIDIAFYGLNEDFGFNRFVSPDQVQQFAFDPIPNAQRTIFINRQENCGCPATLSVAQFDSMVDDGLLRELEITETAGGLEDFDYHLVPRIVLFETEDGRKGAIKIKAYVRDGSNSYILIDIKVQKDGSG